MKSTKKLKPVRQPERLSVAARRQMRVNQLFRHWREWLGQVYGSNRMVPTLDWRGCIAIDRMKREYVLISVNSMQVESKRLTDDHLSSFYFKAPDAKKVFDRYHRLKTKFARSGEPTTTHATHLRPETWTHEAVTDWCHPLDTKAIDFAIASLVAYWDSCYAKPASIRVKGKWGKRGVLRDQGNRFWNLKSLPKLLRPQGLPASLLLQLRKYAGA